MLSQIDWSAVGAIATAFSTAGVILSLIFIWVQLKRLRLSQDVTIALSLYEQSTGPEIHNASLWLKSEMPADFNYEDFKRDQGARKRLESLWYYFEFLGVMVNHDYINKNIIFDQQGAFIAGVWDRSQPLIYARRIDRDSPQYMENFEIMRSKFTDWATTHSPKINQMQSRQAKGYYSPESKSTNT